MFAFFKKKLGITELNTSVAKILANQEDAKKRADQEVRALKAGFDSVYRTIEDATNYIEKIVIDEHKTTRISSNTNIKVLRTDVLASVKKLTEQIETQRKLGMDKEAAYVAMFEKLLKDLDDKLKPVFEEKPKTATIEEKKATYNSGVYDTNYFNALLKNEIPACYNSSTIKSIPSNYQVVNYGLKKVGSGMQNRHCYDNALIYGKERNETVCIGVIFPKSALQQISASLDKVVFTPFLHAWNLTADHQIADYTLGHKRAEEYVYVGRVIAFKDLNAQGLEEILRKETID